MKKLGAIILTFALLIGLSPQLTMAAQNTNFEQELSQYLQKVSQERGFKVSRDMIEESLALNGESIEDYQSVKEMEDSLGEVIKADLSNLDSIYEEYELDKDSLNELLNEYGEEINDYIFLNDLDQAVSFYSEDSTFERDPDFDQNLANYLTQISTERGFEVTKEKIEASLSLYETSLDEFETVKDLSDFLGDVIKADLSNLDYFKENYDLDQQALLKLLEDNGKTINDYVFIDDLEQTVWELNGGDFPGMDEEIIGELLPIFQEEVDLTDEELQRLEDHLLSLEDHFTDPETLAELEELGNRMMAFEDFDTADELSSEQIAELASIYEELLSIFQLKVSYSLVASGKDTPISLIDLMHLEELKGANLKVMIYSLDGKFLADLIVTGEMVDSGTVVDTGEQIKDSADEAAKTVEQSPVIKKKPQKEAPASKTVKGAKLPKTASDYLPQALLGLFFVAAGLFTYRKVRNV
ncbi:processed acidic surface protein [Bacillus sp. USDA818B3_A]|uniref:processed acidic surface protein n=1 Tax=Bacillus sp. USDA818B3_A TaxID=2698834 RepID=UPI00136ECFB3|nr:processed acidic surface protein [Bacillus sp. USDA818B3_A]